MNGSPEVVATLQDAAGLEATLNEQYRLDERCLKFAGVKKLVGKFNGFGDDISHYRAMVIDRIFVLGATPDYEIVSPTDQTSVKAVIENALAIEMKIVTPYEQAVQTAMKALDDTTRNMFEHLLKWHQGHVAWLEKQLRIINSIGEAEYVAEKL